MVADVFVTSSASVYCTNCKDVYKIHKLTCIFMTRFNIFTLSMLTNLKRVSISHVFAWRVESRKIDGHLKRDFTVIHYIFQNLLKYPTSARASITDTKSHSGPTE